MKNLRSCIIDAIRRTVNHCFNIKIINNMICYDIYAEHSDVFEQQDVIQWYNSPNPREAFIDSVSEWYEYTRIEAEEKILKIIKAHWCSKKYPFDVHKEFIESWIKSHSQVNLPYEHYLNQKVRVNIILDNGDSNYDFSLNSMYPHYNGRKEERISEKSSLLWFAKQQGYSKIQLRRALIHSDYSGSRFLESCYRELLNCNSQINALTFLVEMTLDEFFSINEQKKGHIILSKETTCGLCDVWSGAGSLFELEPEREIKIPYSKIHSITPDGDICDIKSLYGVSDNFWPNTLMYYGFSTKGSETYVS